MAQRTSKITSEVLQTCNKFFSSNAESLTRKFPATLSTENDTSRAPRPFRYKITNTEKPHDLPKLTFNDDETPLFAELQPCAKSEFRFDNMPQKWADNPPDSSPFPESIKNFSKPYVTYSDKQKAEDKFIKFKMSSLLPTSRNFSSASSSLVRYYSHRSPADNSSKGNCKGKISKCVKVKRKECLVNENKHCPKLRIRNCKQSKGSHCELRYLDPHCVKKFAPYPSYSEACAEQLPDDPSECQQCPWRTCDDANTIEPGKPVRHKRNYSTYCQRHLETTGGIVVTPNLPPLNKIQEYICNRKCGVSKSPCKEPPGPCEVRKQKEERKRQEKIQRHGGSTKKKASHADDCMVLGSMEGADVRMTNNLSVESPRISLDLDYGNIAKSKSWIDLVDGTEAFLEKQKKPPFCRHNKKPKRPKEKQIDKDKAEIIEYGDIDWWSGRGKSTVVTEPLDNKDCPSQQCPKQHIRSKQEFLLADSEMQASQKGGKGNRIKGDEGHPPPCEENISKSKRCPKEPMKKPRYGKRPSQTPYYKNPEDPYTPDK